jgi:single-stranded DNA-binding protein
MVPSISLVKRSRVVVTGELEQRSSERSRSLAICYYRTRIPVIAQRSWETDAGERRKRIEVVAEEIGASLKYATAEVTSAYRPAEVSS